MLKLNSVLLLMVILCGGYHSVNGEALQCEFGDVHYNVVGTLFSCKVTSLDNTYNNVTINSYTGTHLMNKNDKDVRAIYIHETNIKYIPAGLGSLFNITALAIRSSQLVEIRSKDFYGMQNLESLNLHTNKLTSVPSDTFSMLLKLKVIWLDYNQIKYIGSGAFDQLTDLNRVDLQRNICVNKYYNGPTAISQMKEDLKVNCVEPISTSTTTTTTTTTTQNPMEIELEALKNEANNQQQKNEIELNKLRDDLKKEQLENRKVKNEKDALMINYDVLTQDKDALKMIIDTLLKEKDVWIKENDELKLKLNNKTKDINELNDKLQTNCNPIEAVEALDVKMNVINAMMEQLLKASKEHQIECQEIIKLREELETAKDQQKIEENEKDQLMKQLIKDKEAMEEEKNLMKTEYELELSNKITKINELNEKNENCNKEYNEQLSHHHDHDSANVGRLLK